MAELMEQYVKGKTKKTTKEKLAELKSHFRDSSKEIAGESKSVKSPFTRGKTPAQKRNYKKALRMIGYEGEAPSNDTEKKDNPKKKYKKLKTTY